MNFFVKKTLLQFEQNITRILFMHNVFFCDYDYNSRNKHHWCFLFNLSSWSLFSVIKTVCHISCNWNKIKHIPHVELCLFIDVWLPALKSFTYLHKSYLSSTTGQTRLISIDIINIEWSYANRTIQKSMKRIICVFGQGKNRESFLLLNFRCYLYISVPHFVHYFVILCWDDCCDSLNCVWIFYKQRECILFRCNKVMVQKSIFKNLC